MAHAWFVRPRRRQWCRSWEHTHPPGPTARHHLAVLHLDLLVVFLAAHHVHLCCAGRRKGVGTRAHTERTRTLRRPPCPPPMLCRPYRGRGHTRTHGARTRAQSPPLPPLQCTQGSTRWEGLGRVQRARVWRPVLSAHRPPHLVVVPGADDAGPAVHLLDVSHPQGPARVVAHRVHAVQAPAPAHQGEVPLLRRGAQGQGAAFEEDSSEP